MIRVYFGNIGCGKTTLACRQFFKLQKRALFNIKKNRLPKYDNYFCNFDCSIADNVSLEGLGSWTFPPNSYIIVDEAGIEYNNRKYKSLPQETISWFKLSRHYQCDVDVLSQSWDDMDITIRRLASELWYVRKLGPFTMLRRIYKRVGIDSETHQICDYYEFGKILPCILPFPFHQHNIEIFLRFPYYKFFNTLEAPDCNIIPCDDTTYNSKKSLWDIRERFGKLVTLIKDKLGMGQGR
ncbi:MAG: hypothetical protein E7539_01105 [Ruminococcaceae bacterium]|nr:hypothetical protein [Oscillospiraceae bacterium]